MNRAGHKIVDFLRKILLILLCLSALVGFAYAENINTAYPQIEIDKYHADNELDFVMNALYMQQTYITYVPEQFRTLYDWGFDMRGVFKGNDRRFFYVNWYHYNTEQSNLKREIKDFNFEGPILVDYSYSSQFDVMTIQGGQVFYSSDVVGINLHAGLLLAKMKITQDINLASASGVASESKTIDMLYQGLGPAIGIDLYYHLSDLIQIYILSDITMISRGGNYSVNNSNTNQKGTQTSTLSDNLKGAIEGINFEAGVKSRLPFLSKKWMMQGGWLVILFNEPEVQWSGGFIGARWVGEI